MSNNFSSQKPGMGVTGWCLLISALALFTTLFFEFYQMKTLFFF